MAGGEIREAAPRERGRTEMRRKDRAVEDDAWIGDLLARSVVGVLATARDGQPFVNSNLFVYDPDEHAIFLHTAARGRTRENAEHEARACFTAFEIGRLLPADRALEFSAEYGGVVAFGRISVVSDEEAARRALQKLMDKYAPHLRPGQDYEPPNAADLARTAVFRLDIEEWSGKRKQAETGFPGAYRFEEVGGKGGG